MERQGRDKQLKQTNPFDVTTAEVCWPRTSAWLLALTLTSQCRSCCTAKFWRRACPSIFNIIIVDVTHVTIVLYTLLYFIFYLFDALFNNILTERRRPILSWEETGRYSKEIHDHPQDATRPQWLVSYNVIWTFIFSLLPFSVTSWHRTWRISWISRRDGITELIACHITISEHNIYEFVHPPVYYLCRPFPVTDITSCLD